MLIGLFHHTTKCCGRYSPGVGLENSFAPTWSVALKPLPRPRTVRKPGHLVAFGRSGWENTGPCPTTTGSGEVKQPDKHEIARLHLFLACHCLGFGASARP